MSIKITSKKTFLTNLICACLAVFTTVNANSTALECKAVVSPVDSKNQVAIAIDKIYREFKMPAPYGFNQISKERLQYIIEHPDAAELISQRNNAMKGKIQPFGIYTGEIVKFMARYVLSEIHMMENANEPLQSLFPGQARLAGLTIKNWGNLYRLDFRSPQELMNADGIHGNSNKKRLSLIAHGLPESVGGTWTSFTKIEANHFLLRNLYTQRVYTTVEVVKTDSREYEILKKIRSLEKTSDYFYLRVYEYQVKDQDGVEPEYGIEAEKEVITPDVTSQKITAYREVIYFFESDYNERLTRPPVEWDELRPKYESVYTGPWIPFTK